MGVQADEFHRSLVWRPACFAVLYVLAAWTVPERVAVSCEVNLQTHGQSVTYANSTPTDEQSLAYLFATTTPVFENRSEQKQ